MSPTNALFVEEMTMEADELRKKQMKRFEKTIIMLIIQGYYRAMQQKYRFMQHIPFALLLLIKKYMWYQMLESRFSQCAMVWKSYWSSLEDVYYHNGKVQIFKSCSIYRPNSIHHSYGVEGYEQEIDRYQQDVTWHIKEKRGSLSEDWTFLLGMRDIRSGLIYGLDNKNRLLIINKDKVTELQKFKNPRLMQRQKIVKLKGNLFMINDVIIQELRKKQWYQLMIMIKLPAMLEMFDYTIQ